MMHTLREANNRAGVLAKHGHCYKCHHGKFCRTAMSVRAADGLPSRIDLFEALLVLLLLQRNKNLMTRIIIMLLVPRTGKTDYKEHLNLI